jgi:hypothetical protein
MNQMFLMTMHVFNSSLALALTLTLKKNDSTASRTKTSSHETTFAFDAFKGVLVFLILAVRNKCLSINRVAFDVLNMFARIHQHS